jgi:hypothetical protein
MAGHMLTGELKPTDTRTASPPSEMKLREKVPKLLWQAVITYLRSFRAFGFSSNFASFRPAACHPVYYLAKRLATEENLAFGCSE